MRNPDGQACGRRACSRAPLKPNFSVVIFASLLLLVACGLRTPRPHVQPGGQRCAFAPQGYHVGPGIYAVLCLLCLLCSWCALVRYVLCCAVLYYAVLCDAVLGALVCYACCAMLWYAMLCYAVRCYAGAPTTSESLYGRAGESMPQKLIDDTKPMAYRERVRVM